MEYHEGRKLTDNEVLELIRHNFDILLIKWAELGKWISRIDELKSRDVSWNKLAARPILGIAVNNPTQEEKDRRSTSMKAVWAAKRARGERLPQPKRAPSREFGQRTAWRTSEQKLHQSIAMKEKWRQRKAELLKRKHNAYKENHSIRTRVGNVA
jgi:hypothetical protein